MNITQLGRVLRTLTVLSLVFLFARWPAGAVGPDGPVGEWSQGVWRSVLQSDRASLDSFDKLFGDVPAPAGGEAAVARFRDSFELHRANRDKARTLRDASRAEAREKMRAHIEADELSQALRSAVEVQTLSDNLDVALWDPEVQRIIEWARQEIPEVEADRRWLLGQELLFRLRTLYDETSEAEAYEELDEHLERVNRRVSLLSRYAPRRLHELRSQRAERRGDEPLGEFNPVAAGDWRERLEGVNRRMLTRALTKAAGEHIETAGWRPLYRGGLEALKLLATTAALEESFPLLGNADAVERWVAHLDRKLAWLDRHDDADLAAWTLTPLLDKLVEVNFETISVDRSVIYREFGDGAMYELDPFSEIIWPRRFPRFTQATRGNFVGVGIVIRHDDKREIMVVNPLEGTPAYSAGVKPNDRIAEVDGVSTVGWSLNDAVDKITGRKGTKVTLGLSREGAEDLVEVTIERAVIKIRSVKGWWKEGLDRNGEPLWDWYVDPISRIAYIRLAQFTEDTYDDLKAAWAQIKAEGKPNGLILDLRYNPGGLLSSAVRISNLFVKGGVIVSGEDKDGGEAWPDQRAEARWAIIAGDGVPTVVLINKGSASASEIVAGCLQAHGAAVVIGERSFGKGSVQTVHHIASNGLLKLTTQYYRLPSPDGGKTKGRLVHKRPGATEWGVDPDIVVEMTPAQIVASLQLRQKADIIPADEAGNPDPALPERPDVNDLLTAGIDPQLETALLILQARALESIDPDARHAFLN